MYGRIKELKITICNDFNKSLFGNKISHGYENKGC